jgi:hypothetical protein
LAQASNKKSYVQTCSTAVGGIGRGGRSISVVVAHADHFDASGDAPDRAHSVSLALQEHVDAADVTDV